MAGAVRPPAIFFITYCILLTIMPRKRHFYTYCVSLMRTGINLILQSVKSDSKLHFKTIFSPITFFNRFLINKNE